MMAVLRSSAQKLLFSRTGVFVVAFLLSFAWVLAGRTYIIPQLENHFFFGWEMGRIGASVASGNGFSSPLPLPTGPTAFAPPVYPLLIALAFKLFGIYSIKSALVLLLLNCVFSGCTAVVMRELGVLLGHQAAGALAGWAWAIYPYAAYANSHDIWDTCLTTLLLTVLVYAAYRMREASNALSWVGFGALCAATTLTSSSVVLVVAALWGWLAWRRWRRGIVWLKPAALTVAGFVLLMSPWWIRNYKVMGQFIPLRTNFWLQAWLGNCRDGVLPNHGKPEDYFANIDYYNAIYWEHDEMMPNSEDPSAQRRQYQEYARLGELNYMTEKRQTALHCIAANPGRFLEFTGRRFAYTWTSAFYIDIAAGHPLLQGIWEAGYTALSLLALAGLWVLCKKKDLDLALPFGLVLLVYPAIYYLTHVLVRYRYPIDPELFLLAGIAVHSGYQIFFGRASRQDANSQRTLAAAG